MSTYEDRRDEVILDKMVQRAESDYAYSAQLAGQTICRRRHGKAMKIITMMGVRHLHYRCDVSREVEVRLMYAIESPSRLSMDQVQKFNDRWVYNR